MPTIYNDYTGGESVVNIGPGQSSIEDWVDLAFYGVRQNPQTGEAYIDIIAGDQPVRLPDANTILPTDYRNWTWSSNTFNFYWDSSGNGRLIMEVF
jgi:hypothetical protein